jgi:hypothetical protein
MCLTCTGSRRLWSCVGFRCCYSGHPCSDFIEISFSSYDLSIFSLKAGSHHDKGAIAVPRESSSISIGDAWPEVDSGHGVDHEDAFAIAVRYDLGASTLRPQSGTRGSKRKISQSTRAVAESAWLD